MDKEERNRNILENIIIYLCFKVSIDFKEIK